jgi:hypothetical protein
MKRLLVLALISVSLFAACKKEKPDDKKPGPAAQRCLLKELRSDGDAFLKVEYDFSRRISKITMDGESFNVTYLPDGKIDKLIADSSSSFIRYTYPSPEQIIKEEVDESGEVYSRNVLTLTTGFVTKDEYYSRFVSDSLALESVTEIKRDVFGNRMSQKTFDSDGNLTDMSIEYADFDGKKNPMYGLPYGLSELEMFDSPQNVGKITMRSSDGSIDEEETYTYDYNEHGYATRINMDGDFADFILDCL